MRATPSKWTFTLGPLDVLIHMSEAFRTNHLRHGTDPRPRTDDTLDETDAVLRVGIARVRFFAAGYVRPS